MKKTKAYYVIINGVQRGITDSWAECRESVNRYPGNHYKGFLKLGEAADYLKQHLAENKGPYGFRLKGENREFQTAGELVEFVKKIAEETQGAMPEKTA